MAKTAKPKLKTKGQYDGHVYCGMNTALTHRSNAVVESAFEIDCDPGHYLTFSVVPELTNHGVLALNAGQQFSSGKVAVHLVNVGKEIVPLTQGQKVAVLHMHKVVEFEVIGGE